MEKHANDDTNSWMEPWPFDGILNYTSIEDGEWGYLFYSDETKFIFITDKRPSDEEILKRWGRYLKK